MVAVVNKSTFSKVFWPVLAWTVAIVFFFPIFWMVLTSFKTDADAVKPEHLIVFTPTLENYLNMIENYDFWRFAKNSVITSLFATTFTLFVGVPAFRLDHSAAAGERFVAFCGAGGRAARPVRVPTSRPC